MIAKWLFNWLHSVIYKTNCILAELCHKNDQLQCGDGQNIYRKPTNYFAIVTELTSFFLSNGHNKLFQQIIEK